jgi:hypothetical protein
VRLRSLMVKSSHCCCACLGFESVLWVWFLVCYGRAKDGKKVWEIWETGMGKSVLFEFYSNACIIGRSFDNI